MADSDNTDDLFKDFDNSQFEDPDFAAAMKDLEKDFEKLDQEKSQSAGGSQGNGKTGNDFAGSDIPDTIPDDFGDFTDRSTSGDGSGAAPDGGFSEELNFEDELEGLIGNKAKQAVIVTQLSDAQLLAAFCQLSDISADCLASAQGAVAVLHNLDGDGPEAAAKDLTTVVSGLSVVLIVNRAEKIETTLYFQGEPGEHFPPPMLFGTTAPFVEDLMLGITDLKGIWEEGVDNVSTKDMTRDDALEIIAEHTRFGGRGSSSIK